MNIIERKRRLAAEALSYALAETIPYEAQTNPNDTDDIDSEEVDIFERKDKFEKLLKKFK